MSRILFLAPSVPWPLDSGGRIRTANLLRSVQGLHDVELWCVEDPCNAPEELERLASFVRELRVFPRSAPGPLTHLSGPKQESWFWSRALVQALGEVPSDRFDLLHVDELCMTRMLPRRLPVPHVQHHHKLDLEWMHATTRGGARRSLEAQRWSLLERESVQRAVAQVFVCEPDARRFMERHGQLSVGAIENGVDTREFSPQGEPREPEHLLFLGSLDYAPNARGLELFLRVAWPALKRQRPALQLSLVGRGARPPSLHSLPTGVTWVGAVRDVRPWLASAAALVVPLYIGGGTRLKILEAAAMGCPIVSTLTGAEGLRFRDGVDLLLASSVDGLVPRILETLDGPSQAAMRCACARECVEQHHDWAHLARGLATLWTTAPSKRR